MNMKNSKGMFTSATDDWSTPPEVFTRLDEEFDFTLDPCCTHENATCAHHFTREDNGLAKPWFGRVFMNPPYGRVIGDWMEKALYENRHRNVTVVCLVPARTDTAWWHDYAMKAHEIRLIRGRLKFGGCKNAAPFPSAVIVFKARNFLVHAFCKLFDFLTFAPEFVSEELDI